jgi:hypothetical protein
MTAGGAETDRMAKSRGSTRSIARPCEQKKVYARKSRKINAGVRVHRKVDIIPTLSFGEGD